MNARDSNGKEARGKRCGRRVVRDQRPAPYPFWHIDENFCEATDDGRFKVDGRLPITNEGQTYDLP